MKSLSPFVLIVAMFSSTFTTEKAEAGQYVYQAPAKPPAAASWNAPVNQADVTFQAGTPATYLSTIIDPAVQKAGERYTAVNNPANVVAGTIGLDLAPVANLRVKTRVHVVNAAIKAEARAQAQANHPEVACSIFQVKLDQAAKVVL
jgi:hypothetical protein